jgi:hypothetical protein
MANFYIQKKFFSPRRKDTKLNRLLTRACKPVIDTYCKEYSQLEIDHGDTLDCLAEHKDADEVCFLMANLIFY